VSRFHVVRSRLPISSNDRGHGYYLAAEEEPVERVYYDLFRVDDAFMSSIKFELNSDLNDHANMALLVELAQAYFEQNPTKLPFNKTLPVRQDKVDSIKPV
jgi:hypothetical protein